MRKLFFVLVSVLLFAVSTVSVSAQVGPQQNFQKRILSPASSNSASPDGGNLQVRAQKEINRRIDSLKKLMGRINEVKRLSPEQKKSLITEVQSQIDSLEALQTKIATETDPQVLRTDVQSIVKDYRIYLLFIPKMAIIATADRMLNVADQESSLAAKLQTRLTAAQSAGKDVTTLQASLTDMNAKITDAKTQAQNAMNAVVPLTPEGYPANKVTLQSARTQLQTAYQDLQAGRNDAMTIIKGLQTLKATVSGSPSASCAPRPACLDASPKCLMAEPSGGWCPTTSTTP